MAAKTLDGVYIFSSLPYAVYGKEIKDTGKSVKTPPQVRKPNRRRPIPVNRRNKERDKNAYMSYLFHEQNNLTKKTTQTEVYLEEIEDFVDSRSVSVQTESFMDRPPRPKFIPQKSGNDTITQTDPAELFHFDEECQPMLSVLVGKTVEQALLEVLEEDELAAIRRQVRQYQELRNADLIELQRFQEEDMRFCEEKQRRFEQSKNAKSKIDDTITKLAAQRYARQCIMALVELTITRLSNQGHFQCPDQNAVENEFMPKLLDDTAESLAIEHNLRCLVDQMIIGAMNSRNMKQNQRVITEHASGALIEPESESE